MSSGSGISTPSPTMRNSDPGMASPAQQTGDRKPEPGELVYQQCSQCSFCYSNSTEQLAHQQTHEHTPDPALHFHCKGCPYATDDLNTFKRHVSCHIGDHAPVVYKCQECTMKTTQFDHLEVHMDRQHKISECMCDTMKIEVPRLDWTCKLCQNKYFSQKMYLTVHMYKVHKLTASQVKLLEQESHVGTEKRQLSHENKTPIEKMVENQLVAPGKQAPTDHVSRKKTITPKTQMPNECTTVKESSERQTPVTHEKQTLKESITVNESPKKQTAVTTENETKKKKVPTATLR